MVPATPSRVQAPVPLPNKKGSLKFVVLGDFGTGGRGQYDLAARMALFHETFKFDLVITVGDNLYGSQRPQDFRSKFETPYKPLLDAGVKFYAALGNHDTREQRYYKLFNMDGRFYYSFKAPGESVRFFMLDTTYPTPEQFGWLEKELKGSSEGWKIAVFHHPLYSSGGRHGSDLKLRETLEPLLVQYGVSAAFTGHDHFYERIKPQRGIVHFIVGSGGQLAAGDIDKSSLLTAKGFDTENVFLAVEISGDEMYIQRDLQRGTSRRLRDHRAAQAGRVRSLRPSLQGGLSARVALFLLVLGLTLSIPGASMAQQPPFPGEKQPVHDLEAGAQGLADQLRIAAVRLPLAALLGAMLALRPRRRGTPPRRSAVVETQILLAIIGTVVMLVIGASLARAFGIVGVAGLIRYRSKIDDPKDAVVMLSALAVGLASGVGLYALSVFSTVFLVAALWVIESFEPRTRIFELSVKLGDKTAELRPRIESVLRRYKSEFEVRTVSEEEAAYIVTAPFAIATDDASKALVALDPEGKGAVEWKEITKKEAK